MNETPARLYRLTVWSLSAGLFAASGMLLILMLSNVIGPFRFGTLDAGDRERAIGFWIPADGQRPYPREIAQRTEAWRRLVRRDDIVIESDRLRDLLNARVSAVVLPDARQLEPEQADALDRYMQEGGGIVVSGSIGVRDAAGEWLGYATMRELLRADSIAPLAKEHSQAVAPHRRGPLAAGLHPGHRTALIPEPGVPGLADPDSELRWAGEGADRVVHGAASRRVRRGLGRLAWVGPGPEVVAEARQEDVRELATALGNALAWVRKQPVLELGAWPDGARFAAEIWKREEAREGPLAPGERRRVETEARAALDAAAAAGEFVLIELPVAGQGDAWAEALRVELIARARAAGAWLTTRQDASDWTARRASLRFAVRTFGPNRLLVDVTNSRDEEVEGAALTLWINRPAGSVSLAAVALGQSLPALRFDRSSESAELALPRLGADATLSFYVDLDRPDSEESGALRSG